MRTRLTAAFLVAAAVAYAPAPAAAQQGGMTTETQERQKGGGDSDLIWNLLGCLGLVGIFGLQRPSDNDGYTDDPI